MKTKIDRKKVYNHYMKWVNDVTKACDRTPTFDPKEIVEAICGIIETKDVRPDVKLITDEELKGFANKTTIKKNCYAVYHKPTKLWVYFRQHKDKLGIVKESTICLCRKPDATVLESFDEIKNLVLIGDFNQTPNYGMDNFLEFDIKKIGLSNFED